MQEAHRESPLLLSLLDPELPPEELEPVPFIEPLPLPVAPVPQSPMLPVPELVLPVLVLPVLVPFEPVLVPSSEPVLPVLELEPLPLGP